MHAFIYKFINLTYGFTYFLTVNIFFSVDFNKGLRKNTGVSIALQQYYGLLNKRALHMWRSRFMILIQLVIPVLLAVFGLLADQSMSELDKSHERASFKSISFFIYWQKLLFHYLDKTGIAFCLKKSK